MSAFGWKWSLQAQVANGSSVRIADFNSVQCASHSAPLAVVPVVGIGVVIRAQADDVAVG